MLFAPVPSTYIFEQHHEYYRKKGWCEPDGTVRDLHMINGKLYPFMQLNDGSVEDYIELQRMMFMLNQSYRSKSFNVFGESSVAQSFRHSVAIREQNDFKEDEPKPATNANRISRNLTVIPWQTRMDQQK
jgi:hypothetical protein